MSSPVLWITAPNGTANGSLRASLVAMPFNIGKVSVPPAEWGNWTANVFADDQGTSSLAFTVEFSKDKTQQNRRSVTPVPDSDVNVQIEPGYTPDRSWWTLIFPGPSDLLPHNDQDRFVDAVMHYSAKQSNLHAEQVLLGFHWLQFHELSKRNRIGGKMFSDEQRQKYAWLSDDSINKVLAIPDPLRDVRWRRFGNPGTKPILTKSTAFSDVFRNWIARQIQSPDAEVVSEARRAERNAYRLSREPWGDLDDYALAMAWYMALRDQQTDPNLTAINKALLGLTDNRREALRMAITLGRVSDEKSVDQPDLGFGDKLAMLGAYPELLRKLGVIIDIVFPSVSSSGPFECVRVIVKKRDAQGQWVPLGCSAWTLLEQNAFYARPLADSRYKTGVLNPEAYTLDIKNSEAYLLKAAAQAFSSDETAVATTGPTASGGIVSVALLDRASQLQKTRQLSNRFHNLLRADVEKDSSKANLKMDEMQDVTFDMLVRGFVPQVRVNGDTYLSLCKRSESYEILRKDPGSSENPVWNAGYHEGFVSTGATTTHDSTTTSNSPSSKRDLHLSDTLLCWNGWSAAVPKRLQQLAIDQDDTAVGEHTPKSSDGPLVTAKMSIVPKSLPRLRYGNEYAIKMLCKDLAGNLRDPETIKVAEKEIPTARFLRFEPVPPPELLLTSHLDTEASPGEQLTTMVFREPREGGNERSGESMRLIVPPRCPLEIAELCGQFDDTTPFQVGSFEQADFDEGGKFPHDEDPKDTPGQQDGVQNASDGGKKNPIYRPRLDPPKACQYLPDPYADGFLISIRDLTTNQFVLFDQGEMESTRDAGGSPYLKLSFYDTDDWPKAQTCLIVLSEQDEGNPNITVSLEERHWMHSYRHRGKLRALVVSVPMEREAEVYIQSWTSPENAKKMALPYLQAVALSKEFYKQNKAKTSSDAIDDFHAILCEAHTEATRPARTLRLVHASPQPEHVPTIPIIKGAGRKRNQTFQEFENVEICVDRASTAKANLGAAWTEWIDNNDQHVPFQASKNAPVCEVAIAPPYDMRVNGMNKADNSHKKICTEEPLPDTADPKCNPPYWRTRLHGTFKPDDSVTTGRVRHDFGDTRYRSIYYSCLGETRFNSCYSALPSPDAVDLSNTKNVAVLNSSIPPVPAVAFIVPLFGWGEDRGEVSHDKKRGVVYRSARQGGGCRIYLARPWYVTGDDEKLGIVVWDDGSLKAGGKQETRDVVTRWGADPIWEGQVAIPGPRASQMCGLFDPDPPTLEAESPVPGVIVNAAAVKFDERKNLWYTDIWFKDVPAYFCFLRFALVRYQQHSIAGCKFSSVIRAQFTQLLPDRCVSVSRSYPDNKVDKNKLDIFLSGKLPNAENTYSLQVQGKLNSLSKDLWVPISDEIVCDAPASGELLAHWRVDSGKYCGELRFLILEYESHLHDKTAGKDLLSTTEPAKRMVFANVIQT